MASLVYLFLIAATSNALKLNKNKLRGQALWDEEKKHCKFFYLDIGSNIGVQVRKLFEPNLYPNAPVLPLFNKHFGKQRGLSKNTGICAIGFEANPHHARRLHQLTESYQKEGYDAVFLNRVVGTTDDEDIDFYPNTNGKKETAGSIKPYKGWGGGKPAKMKVKSIDISNFIKTKVLSQQREKVVAKMDIEGSEYLVIPKMLKEGLLCAGKIDFMFLEWHDQHRPKGVAITRSALVKQIKEAKYCNGAAPTTLMSLDDESYADDGKKLPNDYSTPFYQTPLPLGTRK